jgi:DNA-directed RNA polymerase subunit K/omega
MVDEDYENDEKPKPFLPRTPSRDLINYYQLPLDPMIAKAKDRYELVMKAAKIARKINATRLRYGIPRPEKATVVALNEVLQSRVIEARKPEDILEPLEDEPE